MSKVKLYAPVRSVLDKGESSIFIFIGGRGVHDHVFHIFCHFFKFKFFEISEIFKIDRAKLFKFSKLSEIFDIFTMTNSKFFRNFNND